VFIIFKDLLRGSKPVMVMTVLVAILGITGTAYGARLITGFDIKDGSITAVDLAKSTKASLHGAKGNNGVNGSRGLRGRVGAKGSTGAQGNVGNTGSAGVAGATGSPGPAGATGAAGAAGANNGEPCATPGGTGVIHWALVSGTTYAISCVV
jgi:hypothetical protein